MEWAALISWIVTALGGFVLLGLWVQNGGMAASREPDRRIKPPLIFTHFGLAATGLVLWLIYVFNDSDTLAWIAFAILVVVALIGWTMFAIWWQRRQARAGAAATPGSASGEPAEQNFPVGIVTLHGLLAVTTVVLVFLAAIGV